jgi:hypothetical protein
MPTSAYQSFQPLSSHRVPMRTFFFVGALVAIWLVSGGMAWGQAGSTIRVRLADGFDFPVGKPNAVGYHKARGYWPNGHMGEDWNGNSGGDTDLGAPIYSMGRGVVIFSQNIGVGWGNCILVRHVFRELDGRIAMVDSLYAHLQERKVKLHQLVEKGELVGTMGGNNGMYLVHLHFEVRKNLRIGMNRSSFARDNSNYYSPTAFINDHRQLASSTQKYDVPVNNFAPYGRSLANVGNGPRDAVDVPSFKPGASGVANADQATESTDFWSRLKAKIRSDEPKTDGADKP